MTAARPTVTLYCQPGCAKCRHVHSWLDDLDAFDVIELDATGDPGARTFLLDRGFRGLPVVHTPDGRAAWGVEPHKLTAELPLLAHAATRATPETGPPRSQHL